MLMMEMYHGRSMAFKDLSMTCAAQILDFFLERAESTVNLLIGKWVIYNSTLSSYKVYSPLKSCRHCFLQRNNKIVGHCCTTLTLVDLSHILTHEQYNQH